MEEENTKNGWDITSKAQALFTRRQPRTVPTRTALQNGQIEPLWKGSGQSLQRQSSTKGSGWILRIRSFTSKIAAQRQRSLLRPTNSGTEPSQISPISELWVKQGMSMFQR